MGYGLALLQGLALAHGLVPMAGLVCRLPVGEGHGLAYGLWFGIASGLGLIITASIWYLLIFHTCPRMGRIR